MSAPRSGRTVIVALLPHVDPTRLLASWASRRDDDGEATRDMLAMRSTFLEAAFTSGIEAYTAGIETG
ncbi:hypothetical protein [Ferrimicrobium sp.]|uniref:hypothetical protein n=1 Tax=Ferrimicrobium sp. TaxID=2926050 RepID=UPI002630402E|nr:hypothetical protein [Ferrimicrobium sp.]